MNRVAAAAVLWLVLATGCPAVKHGTVPLGTSPPVAIAPTTELIARAGEQMTYRISIHNLDVAEFVVAVGAPAVVDGKDVIVVQTHAVSSPLLSWLHPVDDTLTSWIHRATGRPVAFKSIEMASHHADDFEETVATYAPGEFPMVVTRHGKSVEARQVVRDEAYDVPSMLTFLRGWDGAPGTEVAVDVLRALNVWRANLVIVGPANVTTALGDLPVVRYDGEGVRLLRDGTIDPTSDRRKFSIWITDDADRVPAKMVAHTDYGDIQVELVGYRAR